MLVGLSIDLYDMVADKEAKKISKPRVPEFFMRKGKLEISVVFISQSCFPVSNTIRPSKEHYSLMKILNKRELQQIALNHSYSIEFKDFMKLYKNYTK